jgi:sugar/nucleoside kinase (ribokinase family)
MGRDRLDILGLGAVAVDDLLVVATYPAADAKARVLGRHRQCGGLTGTALVAAARLGSRCGYAGVLGVDELSDLVVDNFAREGVDVSIVQRRPGVGPIRSTIVIGRDDATRTVFSDRNGFEGPDPDWPDPEVIRSVRVLFVDHLGVPATIRAARIAREAGIPVVADFERVPSPDFADLLDLADHLIIGRSFAADLTGETDPGAAALALWRGGRSAVVVTCGIEGCWAVDGSDRRALRRQPAFPVATVDTTGCGDVFHGAYASALARGDRLDDRLRLASASAALKATRPGGQAGIPDRAAVLDFLGRQGI